MRRLIMWCMLLILVMAACASPADDGGGDAVAQQGDTEVPPADAADMTIFADQGVSFAYPADWTVKDEQDFLVPDRLIEAVGEEVQEGAPPLVGLTVGPAPLDMDALETSLTTGAFDPGSEVVDSTDVDVAGADAARVVEIVYPNVQELGFDLREQMLLVLDEGNAAVLRVAAPQEQWQGSRATYEAIIDSFSFT